MPSSIDGCCLPPTALPHTPVDTADLGLGGRAHPTGSRRPSIVSQNHSLALATVTEPASQGRRIEIKGNGRSERRNFIFGWGHGPRLDHCYTTERPRPVPKPGNGNEGSSGSDTASETESSNESEECPGSDTPSEAESS